MGLLGKSDCAKPTLDVKAGAPSIIAITALLPRLNQREPSACNMLFLPLTQMQSVLEPIREVLESDESDVIPCWALDSLESARCGSPNSALSRTAVAYVTRAI